MREASLEDMQNMWDGTYVGVQRGSTVLPFHIESVNRGSFDTSCMFSGQLYDSELKDWRFYECSTTDSLLMTDFPDMGMINFPYGATYMSRIPMRQWKRGMYRQLVALDCPVAHELRLTGNSIARLENPQFLEAIYNRQYLSEEEARTQIQLGDALARAFAPNWCYYVKQTTPGILIGYKSHCVGERDVDTARLLPEAEYLKDELSEFTNCEVQDETTENR